jgi:glycosidase
MRISFFLIALFILINGCNNSNDANNKTSNESESIHQPKEYVQLQHPEWTKNATIYQVNIRQYTTEGTFKAFEAHLPRLKEMGVDILWLMPIHPIGMKGRKGTLGSPYSVKDYYGINAEFGDLQAFKHLVDTIHAMDMHVIIDWVANHSARDNQLVTDHPDWYIKSRENNFVSTPWRDYDDIIDFDYTQPGIRAYMTDVMKYWVKETNIDGFRCDVASFVPIDFWETTRAALDSIKPVFMLAEAADRDLHQRSFNMTYSWALWDALHNITTKNASIELLTGGYIAEHVSIWPRNAIRMNFIDNHDKNAWEGTTYTNFGKGLQAAIVLTGTMDGMPMMYSGQEAGLNRALPFFEKDLIEWKEDTVGTIYTKLFHLKHSNEALWNGKWGGEMVRIKNNNMKQVISFVREKNNHKVITIVNLSNDAVQPSFETQFDKGTYKELFTDKEYTLTGNDRFQLAPWGYLVLVKK